MPKNGIGGLTCPLCLGVDDPSGMLSVVIERQVPRAQAEVSICLRCVDAIAKGMAEFGRAEVESAPNINGRNRIDSDLAGDASERRGLSLDPGFADQAHGEDASGVAAEPTNTDGSNEKLI